MLQIPARHYNHDVPPISRVVLPILTMAFMLANTGCSNSGSGSSGLETALARVSDTANNRDVIYYDNTAELVTLVGSSLSAESKGYGQLRGLGASSIVSFADTLPGETGINLFDENYAITAGNPSVALTLVAGGQDASLVTGRLTRLGWKKNADGALTGPPPLGAPGDSGTYAIAMAKVQADNSDVLFGASSANLSQIGSPSGTTLAGDSGISALAGCLGNAVAAAMFGGPDISSVTAAPAEVAVGISQPASASATPHAVVCVSWPSQAAAGTYAANVRKALATGLSPLLNERFSAVLPHATVTSVGGDAHVVEWQASSPNIETVFNLVDEGSLPALPDCSKMTPAQAAQVIGCD